MVRLLVLGTITHGHEDGKGPTPYLGLAVHISQTPRNDRNGSAPKDAAEEAKHQEGGPIVREAASQGEDEEEDKGSKGDGPAADMLTQRTPEDGTEDIAD